MLIVNPYKSLFTEIIYANLPLPELMFSNRQDRFCRIFSLSEREQFGLTRRPSLFDHSKTWRKIGSSLVACQILSCIDIPREEIISFAYKLQEIRKKEIVADLPRRQDEITRLYPFPIFFDPFLSRSISLTHTSQHQ